MRSPKILRAFFWSGDKNTQKYCSTEFNKCNHHSNTNGPAKKSWRLEVSWMEVICCIITPLLVSTENTTATFYDNIYTQSYYNSLTEGSTALYEDCYHEGFSSSLYFCFCNKRWCVRRGKQGKHAVVAVRMGWPEPQGGMKVYVVSTLIQILHFTDTMR